MATTREGGAGGVREKDGKRGNPSSNPQTKKPTTKPSTPSQRAVPSNLKPAIRSKVDPSSSSRAPLRSNSSKKLASVNRKQSADKFPTPSSPQTVNRGLTSATKAAPKRSFSSPSVASRPAATPPFIRRSLSTRASPSVAPGKKAAVKKTSPRGDTSVELPEKDPLDHIIGCGQDVSGLDEDEVQSLHDITDILGHDHQLGDPAFVMQELATADTETTTTEGAGVPEEQAPLESVESADGDAVAEEVVPEEDSTKVEEKHMVAVVQGNKEGDQQVKEAAEEVKIVKPLKQLTQSVSKKETQAYNDVIEETVSKLMENRRNRVRALAGAFETVISLDSKY